MTRDEVKSECLEWLIDNTEKDGRLPQTSCKNMIEDIVDELFDDFEKQIAQLKRDREYWKRSFKKQVEASRKKYD